MRLLNTTKRELEEFGGNEIPLYAILSHTWGESEITFQDIEGDDAEKKVEYEKVRNICDIAAAHRFDYVWIDTCCIDKVAAPSYPRQSIRCIHGTRTQRCVTHTCQTSQN